MTTHTVNDASGEAVLEEIDVNVDGVIDETHTWVRDAAGNPVAFELHLGRSENPAVAWTATWRADGQIETQHLTVDDRDAVDIMTVWEYSGGRVKSAVWQAAGEAVPRLICDFDHTQVDGEREELQLCFFGTDYVSPAVRITTRYDADDRPLYRLEDTYDDGVPELEQTWSYEACGLVSETYALLWPSADEGVYDGWTRYVARDAEGRDNSDLRYWDHASGVAIDVTAVRESDWSCGG